MTASQPGVDRDALVSWLRRRGLGQDLDDLRPLAGGTQNVVLRMVVDGRRLVLRRPSVHPRPGSDRVMLREIAVLRALSGGPVPHPALVAAEDNPSVLGAVFYVMEDVAGFNPGTDAPARYAQDGVLRHAAALSVPQALAHLGRVDAGRPELAPLRRPGSFLARQVPQWTAALSERDTVRGYRAADLPAVADVATWLEGNRPADQADGLVHGDFHLNNVLLAEDRPAVTAIVDWELATVGDPLLDLGWLLVCWPGDPAPGITGEALARAGDLPTRAEVVAAYASAAGRSTDALDWYAALAAFKLGVVLDGTWARALAGQAPRATGERLHDAAVVLLGLADRIRQGEWSVLAD